MNALGDVRSVRVEIAGRALESVFEECDRYDSDETGGRAGGWWDTSCWSGTR